MVNSTQNRHLRNQKPFTAEIFLKLLSMNTRVNAMLNIHNQKRERGEELEIVREKGTHTFSLDRHFNLDAPFIGTD